MISPPTDQKKKSSFNEQLVEMPSYSGADSELRLTMTRKRPGMFLQWAPEPRVAVEISVQ